MGPNALKLMPPTTEVVHGESQVCWFSLIWKTAVVELAGKG